MKQLILMRHARAVPYGIGPDMLRPLRPSGIDDARAAGQVLARYAIDLAYVSAAKRTRQTWKAATRGGASASNVENVDWLYGASGNQLAHRVIALPADVSTVLFIGHEPGMSSVAAELASPTEDLGAVADHLPTASVIVLQHDGEWAGMWGAAKLADYIFVRA